MKLIHYTYNQDSTCLHFNLILSFDQFLVSGCLYKNSINGCVNFYIYVERGGKSPLGDQTPERAYLAFHVNAPGLNPSNDSKRLKLPEFEKIYQIIGLSQNIINQFDLLNFLAEIVMYYDESGLVGEQPMGPGIPYTINQLVDKLNIYLTRKSASTDYQIIEENPIH